MSVQIDNVKMWEYLIKQSEEYLIFCQIATWLKEALHEQGLEFKDGHIISITKPNADFKIEKGKWYVCTKPFLGFYVGDLGYCDCDGDISHRPNATERYHVVNADCFRPATEEEINGIEPNQENSPILSNSSNTAKNELTEFEKAYFAFAYGEPHPSLPRASKEEIDEWKKEAKELLSLARKQILNELERNN